MASDLTATLSSLVPIQPLFGSGTGFGPLPSPMTAALPARTFAQPPVEDEDSVRRAVELVTALTASLLGQGALPAAGQSGGRGLASAWSWLAPFLARGAAPFTTRYATSPWASMAGFRSAAPPSGGGLATGAPPAWFRPGGSQAGTGSPTARVFGLPPPATIFADPGWFWRFGESLVPMISLSQMAGRRMAEQARDIRPPSMTTAHGGGSTVGGGGGAGSAGGGFGAGNGGV